jgi:hypothetical protein
MGEISRQLHVGVEGVASTATEPEDVDDPRVLNLDKG